MEAFDAARDDVVRAVDACGLFESLSGDVRAELLDAFSGLRLTTGETLMSAGENADELYIVRHGRLRATMTGPDGEDVPVGEIGKGEVVGEMAVITDEDRSATIRAMRDTDLFRLPAEDFGRLIQRHPEMLRPFASVVVNRLRTAMVMPPRPALPATIVLLPTDDPTDADWLARAIAGQLGGHAVAVLRRADVAGAGHPAAHLLDVENSVDVSLLVADAGPTEWTRLCLRHADRVLLVAAAHGSAGRTPVEADDRCRARLADVPTQLVMLHDGRPRSGPWLETRTIESHHNVDRSCPADIGRLARRLTGTATVMVLGGGGARGFAHFGVVRAIKEAGVPIDAIVGTSAGAVVGGLLARVDDPADAQRQMTQWFDEARWRRDFNPPKVSLMSGRTMTEGLRELGDGRHIEDLAVDFAAVSCDLVTATPYVHDRGPLWRALRASGSVPGLFPPVAIDGHLLVDGGLTANLPIALARERHGSSRLIEVEVGDPTDIDLGGLDDSGIVNGWQRLRRRPDSGASLAKLMMRLTELGRHESSELADVLITPDVRGFGLTDTKRAAEIVQRGYEAGVRAIETGVVTV
ncbi:MAG: patatin-like phospholipase family protein [Ilumatobacter sp.]|uniref:patatin-like phospholipase family protein n=1 Tax=Ilumatobacter sp. TaxID=1967498 RepID=UPI002638B602|nr:patatin-like phospholipase family protein [Ilumatobacter sp.]MDJ0770635.1 patatin-like phospholipase family protein [Ilumatobacter sp.]